MRLRERESVCERERESSVCVCVCVVCVCARARVCEVRESEKDRSIEYVRETVYALCLPEKVRERWSGGGGEGESSVNLSCLIGVDMQSGEEVDLEWRINHIQVSSRAEEKQGREQRIYI